MVEQNGESALQPCCSPVMSPAAKCFLLACPDLRSVFFPSLAGSSALRWVLESCAWGVRSRTARSQPAFSCGRKSGVCTAKICIRAFGKRSSRVWRPLGQRWSDIGRCRKPTSRTGFGFALPPKEASNTPSRGGLSYQSIWSRAFDPVRLVQECVHPEYHLHQGESSKRTGMKPMWALRNADPGSSRTLRIR